MLARAWARGVCRREFGRWGWQSVLGTAPYRFRREKIILAHRCRLSASIWGRKRLLDVADALETQRMQAHGSVGVACGTPEYCTRSSNGCMSLCHGAYACCAAALAGLQFARACHSREFARPFSSSASAAEHLANALHSDALHGSFRKVTLCCCRCVRAVECFLSPCTFLICPAGVERSWSPPSAPRRGRVWAVSGAHRVLLARWRSPASALALQQRSPHKHLRKREHHQARGSTERRHESLSCHRQYCLRAHARRVACAPGCAGRRPLARSAAPAPGARSAAAALPKRCRNRLAGSRCCLTSAGAYSHARSCAVGAAHGNDGPCCDRECGSAAECSRCTCPRAGRARSSLTCLGAFGPVRASATPTHGRTSIARLFRADGQPCPAEHART